MDDAMAPIMWSTLHTESNWSRILGGGVWHMGDDLHFFWKLPGIDVAWQAKGFVNERMAAAKKRMLPAAAEFFFEDSRSCKRCAQEFSSQAIDSDELGLTKWHLRQESSPTAAAGTHSWIDLLLVVLHMTLHVKNRSSWQVGNSIWTAVQT